MSRYSCLRPGAGVTSAQPPVGPVVRVVAVDPAGLEVSRFDLGHGADPEEALAAGGLRGGRLHAVAGHTDPHVVELRYTLGDRGSEGAASGVVRRVVASDADLVREVGREVL